MAFARIFTEQAELAKKEGRHYSITLGLRCIDGISYESETLEVFNDEECLSLRPPQSMEMTFHDYVFNRHLQLTAVHGGAYSDRFHVSGEEPTWVRDIFLRVEERLDALESTENWFTKHRKLTTFIGMLGFGSLMHLVIILVIEAILRTFLHDWRPDQAMVERLRQNILLRILCLSPTSNLLNWVCRYFMGGIPWFYFERWFYSAFPSVELDFGPQHLRIDAKRRERIKQFLIVVAIPLVIAVIYDMVKEILKSR